MVNIERTQRDFIRKQINEVVEPARIGEVISVYEHTEEDDNSNFEVTVNFIGEDTQHVQVPYQCVTADGISVPRVGDKVIIEYRRGSDASPIARNFVYTNDDRAPIGKAGMWRKRLPSPETETGDGDLYVTAHTEYDEDVSSVSKNDANPEKSSFQIVKSQPNETIVEDPESGLTIVDSEDGSHITIEGHNIGDEDAISLEQIIDFVEGEISISSEDDENDISLNVTIDADGTITISGDADNISQEMGIQIDTTTGETKILGPSGSGMVLDNSGDVNLVGNSTSTTL